MPNTTALSKALTDAVTKAGNLALDYFGKTIEIETKPDGSKVSQADYAVNNYLEQTLCPLDPAISWLSEESVPSNDRLDAKRVWIIDPIDGTSSFLDHKPDWTIVAALVENGHPILGVVYNPVHNELFQSQKGCGALLNGNPIKTSPTKHLKDAHIITSKSHFNRTFQDKTDQPSYKWRCSMAYRIALVAAGHVEATISLTPKNDWDIAAAHLILEEAGGKIGKPDGTPITYNNAELRHSGVVAATNTLYTSLIERTSVARPPQKNQTKGR